MLALRSTLEALVQEAIGSKNEATSSRLLMAEPTPTIPYPLEAAIEQINVVLDVTEMLLRIERVCFVRKRIHAELVMQEDD